MHIIIVQLVGDVTCNIGSGQHEYAAEFAASRELQCAEYYVCYLFVNIPTDL